MENNEEQKLVHTLVIDAGPIIKNDPSVSSLIAQSHKIVTLPAIIDEIKDSATRARLDSTLRPFLELRNPTPASIKIITDFARRTGDLAVLSRPDVHLLALAYELECERNSGDWRLRRVPGQKTLNGAPPARAAAETTASNEASEPAVEVSEAAHVMENDGSSGGASKVAEVKEDNNASGGASISEMTNALEAVKIAELPAALSGAIIPKPLVTAEASLSVGASESTELIVPDDNKETTNHVQDQAIEENEATNIEETSDSDSDGWITPSNLKKQQEKDASSSLSQSKEPRTMQVATLTSDFAMQNVLLQMNLNLLSSSFQRVRHIKTYILRCHACFEKVRDMSKQFCPRCGKPTLTRVACSTDQNGKFTLHLKKNMQWNTRGDRFSMPKAVGGSSSGKLNVGGGGKGGGKGGWGRELILAEDQKEYTRAAAEQSRNKARDLMDEDYMPGIISSDRMRTGGRIKVGAGRNVNSRKR